MIVYSSNGSDNWSESFDDILYEMEEADTLYEGATYYTGTPVSPSPSEFFDAWRLLEQLEETAFDEYDDCVEGFGEVTKDQLEELQKLVGDWLNKNLVANFYHVSDVQAHKLHADQIF
jgi:N12 class adenine-specific DNA methylase